MKKSRTLVAALVFAGLLGTACLFSPDPNNGTSVGFYSPVDSAWKVIYNFQLAYETKNFDEYQKCLHDEFEFILLEQDWGDYNGDGVIDESWGKDLEELYTQRMFQSDNADVIELILTGTNESPYYGDTTGATVQMMRSFELKVYYYEDGTQKGVRAQGQALFLVKPGPNGDYQIWQWTDLSEV
ncbi:hypothetical protein CSA37_11270 [Candidatus Fermentibacteria bacterium]|nr:MAG: hypothetical protein CSA37_11270 [Candidatus Fermentibacteria bacterium]